MTKMFDGKVALITGQHRGSVRRRARMFVANGAKVVLGDLLESVVELAGELGDDRAVALCGDVANPAYSESLVKLATIDVWAAGLSRSTTLECAGNQVPIDDLKDRELATSHRYRPQRRLLWDALPNSGDSGLWGRCHHQHIVCTWAETSHWVQLGIHRGKARCNRPDQTSGGQSWVRWHPLQCHLSGLYRNTAGVRSAGRLFLERTASGRSGRRRYCRYGESALFRRW